MAKRPVHGFTVRSPQAPDFAFFISHVREDRDFATTLKTEVATISGRGGRRAPIQCFLDRHDWPIGNVPSEAIKDNLLRCEYMIPIVTPRFMEVNRGWVWYELAYSELIELQRNRRHPGVRYPYIAPIFRGVDALQILRTPLGMYWHRSLVDPFTLSTAAEAAMKVVDFYDQEARKRGDPSPS